MAGADEGVLARLVRRDRAVTVAGLATLCALAWAYLLAGAGQGHNAWEMTTLALFPHKASLAAGGMDMAAMGMAGMDADGPMAQRPEAGLAWGPMLWALAAAMWLTMMVAMMAPSAAPAILLYARVHRHAAARGQGDEALAPTGAFLAGYLALWLGFSLLAALLQGELQRRGLISAETLGSRSRWLSAGVLLAAGGYQLSPLKSACLSHCRAPAAFLAHHWRPGAAGAIRLGMLHGAYCLGCCWLLMALLFVGGVMNLAWIGALTVLVLAEKVFPAGPWVARAGGLVLLAWGLATLAV